MKSKIEIEVDLDLHHYDGFVLYSTICTETFTYRDEWGMRVDTTEGSYVIEDASVDGLYEKMAAAYFKRKQTEDVHENEDHGLEFSSIHVVVEEFSMEKLKNTDTYKDLQFKVEEERRLKKEEDKKAKEKEKERRRIAAEQAELETYKRLKEKYEN
jgi:signal transduction histidine kinase